MERKGTASFGSIATIIGSILIACGFAWLIAQNWHQMPDAVKILILFVVTAGSLFLAVMLREKQYGGVAQSLFILGALLYTLSIFLIAQIYSTSTSIQGFSWLLLLAWVGVAVLAYLFVVKGVAIVALLEMLIWTVTQFSAFAERTHGFPFGMLALCFLAIGILFYGLSLAHKEHPFERTYRYFTALYLLLFAFILSFQLIIPELWRSTSGSSITYYLLALAVLAVISIIVGLRTKSWDKREVLGVGAIILLLATVIIISTLPSTVAQQQDENGYCSIKNCYSYDTRAACLNDTSLQCDWMGDYCTQKSCYLSTSQDACVAKAGCSWIVQQTTTATQRCDSNGCVQGKSDQQNYTRCELVGEQDFVPKTYEDCYTLKTKTDCAQRSACSWTAGYAGDWYGKMQFLSPLWFVWVWANIVLLIAILAIIFFGTWTKQPLLINLGMLFFGLMIFSRYVGFIIDLNGYTSLSVLFIIGGVLLIGGGYALEKWRRKLVGEATQESTEGPAKPTPKVKQ